jgi:hypothetical protein
MGQNRATARSRRQQGTRLNLGKPRPATPTRRDAANRRKGPKPRRQRRGCGSNDPSNDLRSRTDPGPFSSIRCWRPQTELQVGTPEAFPRLGLQATAIRRPQPRSEVSDKNDCTVGEFPTCRWWDGLLRPIWRKRAVDRRFSCDTSRHQFERHSRTVG